MTLRFSLLAFLFASCAAPSAPSLHHPDLSLAGTARSGDTNPNVFLSYNPNGPVRWNQSWPWMFDLTGIAWDQPTTATSITPRHVVMANHYQRKVGSTAVFHDRRGKAHQRTVIKIIPTSEVGLQSDVAVGLLDRPLPESIRNYPILEVKDEQPPELAGAHALITDQHRRLFFHKIGLVFGSGLGFRYDTDLDPSKSKKLVSGDSGNPSFLLSKGELALIETHTGGGSGSGPFYGNSSMLAALRKAVATLDPTYQLRTVGMDQKLLKEAAAGRANMPGLSPPRGATSPPATQPSNANPTKGPRKRVVMPPAN
ncbi:hypothetical protein [Haloferula sp.]|uniref:hypothetical protein n=1 Tax=Haloferula sp. TaxID=2497595 RepID=UPI003C7562FA